VSEAAFALDVAAVPVAQVVVVVLAHADELADGIHGGRPQFLSSLIEEATDSGPGFRLAATTKLGLTQSTM
jgi:hypothetical protein